MYKNRDYLELRFLWLRVAAVGKWAFVTLILLTILLGGAAIISRVLGLW